MGIQELPKNVTVAEEFATIRTSDDISGFRDPVCRVAEGTAKGQGDDSRFIVVLDGDSFRGRLGTLEFDAVENDPNTFAVKLNARDKLAEDPALLGGVMQLALERTGVETAIIHPETDTNLPSGDFLRQAGATALATDTFEFHAIAA